MLQEKTIFNCALVPYWQFREIPGTCPSVILFLYSSKPQVKWEIYAYPSQEGFPRSSVGKQPPACNAGDPGLFLRLRSKIHWRKGGHHLETLTSPQGFDKEPANVGDLNYPAWEDAPEKKAILTHLTENPPWTEEPGAQTWSHKGDMIEHHSLVWRSPEMLVILFLQPSCYPEPQ